MIDGQSVTMSWYRAPFWNLRPDITSCRNVAVRNLRSAICSVIIQWSESHTTRNHTLLSHLRLPQPGRPGFRIYIPQEQGGPVITPSIGFPLSRPLRLASHNSQGYGGHILTLLVYTSFMNRMVQSKVKVKVKSQSHVTSDC
jgi:hypothetical protein